VRRSLAPPYQEALSNSGYEFKLKYNPTPSSNKNNKNINRNILWYTTHLLVQL